MDQFLTAHVAFWSDLINPAPADKLGDCLTAFDRTQCNNLNPNWQLYIWSQGAAPPRFTQITPNQAGCNTLEPTALSFNSNDAGVLAFSYNCNPLGFNNDGNYEIFRDPPRRR